MTINDNYNYLMTHIGMNSLGYGESTVVLVELLSKFTGNIYSSYQLMSIYSTYETITFSTDFELDEDTGNLTPFEVTPSIITPPSQYLMEQFGKNKLTIKLLDGTIIFENDIYIDVTSTMITPFAITPTVINTDSYFITPRIIKSFNI